MLQHPIIAECVVMGIPDKDYGEIIAAIVVPHEAQAAAAAAKQEPVLTLQALQYWAQPLLAPYKVFFLSTRNFVLKSGSLSIIW